MNKEEFVLSCEKIGIHLTEKQLQQFIDYADLLVEWNEKMNLTAITQFEEILEKHFYDSLLVSETYPISGSLCDVGAGAGFPSLPLIVPNPTNLKSISGDTIPAFLAPLKVCSKCKACL